MFTKVGDVKIGLNFDYGIEVKVMGPEKWYYVEVREYIKNSNESYYIEGYHITSTNNLCWPEYTFNYRANFFYDFEVFVYRTDLEEGLKLLHNHRFNDYGKIVKFNLSSNNLDETELWVEKCLYYSDIHKCKPIFQTKFANLNKQLPNYYLTRGIQPYKTYNIGRFPKSSTDFKTLGDSRKEDVIWFGHWKQYWSYDHPRPWNKLSSQEIVDDILGL